MLARSCSPETEALGATFRIVERQTERAFLAPIALPSNRVFLTKKKKKKKKFYQLLQSHASQSIDHLFVSKWMYLARALSLVVAIASFVIAARGAGHVATAGPTPGITVVTFGASLAPKPGVAYPAGALSPVVAVGFRRAEGARARPAPNPRHQIPGAGSASVAVLAEGQGWAHAPTCVGVADVARPYARIAHWKISRRINAVLLLLLVLIAIIHLDTRSRKIRNIRVDTCRNASLLHLACSNIGPESRDRKSCALRWDRIRKGRIPLPLASPRTRPFPTDGTRFKVRERGGRILTLCTRISILFYILYV